MSRDRGIAVTSVDLGAGLPIVRVKMDRATRYILDMQVERPADFERNVRDLDCVDIGRRFREALDKIR